MLNHSDRYVPQNRRRRGFQLPGPRHMLPVLCGAVAAAAILHYGGYKLLPLFFPGSFWRDYAPDEVQTPEDRTVVRFQEEESEPELSDEPDLTPQTEEQTESPDEPQEIDLIDMPIEELTMAPGETNLALPDPEPSEDVSLSAPMPAQMDLFSLPEEESTERISIPEISPISNNPLVVKAAPLPADADPEQWIRDELKRQKAQENVPGGTQSLSDLIKISNPGAGAGAARLGADLLFAFNRAELKNSARISMLQLAALIHKNPGTRFIIEGHTDSIGSDAYNALLSLQRANAVRQWLKANGIPMKNVYIRPCGSRSPLVSTQGDRKAQSANRRVEIHMRKSGEKLPSGCLDSSYEVDMKTPIAEQLRKGVHIPGLQRSLLQGSSPASGTSSPQALPPRDVRQPATRVSPPATATKRPLAPRAATAGNPAAPSSSIPVAGEVPEESVRDFVPTASEVIEETDAVADEVPE